MACIESDDENRGRGPYEVERDVATLFGESNRCISCSRYLRGGRLYRLFHIVSCERSSNLVIHYSHKAGSRTPRLFEVFIVIASFRLRLLSHVLSWLGRG